MTKGSAKPTSTADESVTRAREVTVVAPAAHRRRVLSAPRTPATGLFHSRNNHAARQGQRNLALDCAELQCERGHDFEG